MSLPNDYATGFADGFYLSMLTTILIVLIKNIFHYTEHVSIYNEVQEKQEEEGYPLP